jgi:hypothetical protein
VDQVSSIDDAGKQHPTTNTGAAHVKQIFKYPPKKKLTAQPIIDDDRPHAPP